MAEDEDRERPTKLPVLPKKEGEICMLERANGPNILVLTQTPKDPKGEGARAAKVGIGPITSGNWYSGRAVSYWGKR
ncbi:hypothetical protein FOZG_00007 [Fusarium oxysporum Fo47]|uniref:Uncharacterized protein n=1 Tax=Fusarium oxysporum Fo47 TaxID=660027 RepID=W9KX65_FUSOX|nr:hypothetical protein FOZG_00007 [Fusarium oxysporum Fo47]